MDELMVDLKTIIIIHSGFTTLVPKEERTLFFSSTLCKKSDDFSEGNLKETSPIKKP